MVIRVALPTQPLVVCVSEENLLIKELPQLGNVYLSPFCGQDCLSVGTVVIYAEVRVESRVLCTVLSFQLVGQVYKLDNCSI